MSTQNMMTDSETDPNGLDQHSLGAKLDHGKPLPFLVLGEFGNALSAVVDVGTYGANKYTPRGWLYVEDGENRYLNAFLRHQLQYFTGELLDLGADGSGLPHIDMMIWNLLAARELQLRHQKYAEEAVLDNAVQDSITLVNNYEDK